MIRQLVPVPVPVLLVLLLAGACSKGNANGTPDAARDAAATDGPDASGAYRHTIQIDGVDDFLSGEQFPTTSAGYAARVTWDDQNIYVGYSGGDLDPAAPQTTTKWLFVYIDVDPGTTNGALVNEMYNTQGATFPAGFRADFYVRWRCDEQVFTLKQLSAGQWIDASAAPGANRAGNFVEIAIPRVIGGGSRMDLVTWMINEVNGAESSYAGLYTNNFTDGYAANLALTKYLKIDFASERAPNDPANQGP